MSNGTSIAKNSLPHASETESCQTPQSLAMSDHSLVTGTPEHIREWLMSLPAVSPVSHSAQPVNCSEKMTQEICGPVWSNALAWFDQNTRCWRTWQASLLQDTLKPFSETLPRAGMMLGGVLYRQPKWERRISAIESGLLPTPLQDDANNVTRKSGKTASLTRWWYQRFQSRMPPSFPEQIMIWPIGWTALEPLETGKYQQWLGLHGL